MGHDGDVGTAIAAVFVTLVGLVVFLLGAGTPLYRRYEAWAGARRQDWKSGQSELVTRLSFAGVGCVFMLLGVTFLLLSV
ncbi:MAG: hypothetical protein QOE35_886 [Actinomycetota bacterium]|jgi:hypothetical protein